MKCIVCMFSGLITPKLQTSGLTHKGRPFFMTYQTHFLRQYLIDSKRGCAQTRFLKRCTGNLKFEHPKRLEKGRIKALY